MTARVDNAARDLLARLTDESELESRPIDDVRADLAMLGIDPTRAIRLGRRLAEQAASPAGGLLARSLAAEDSDREIANLESSDLRAIQAELSAANPLAAAYAQRLASKAAGQSRHRSSRRFWYGVAGTITAIAASVLILIAVSPTDLGPRQSAVAPQQEVEFIARKREELSSASRSSTEQAAIPNPDALAAPAAPPVTLQAPGDEAVVSRNANGEAGKAVRDPKAEAESVRMFESFANSSSNLGGASVDGQPANLPTSRGGVADLTVTAALILQPERVPEALRHATLGRGELEARLSDAAHDRRYQYIVALVTLRRPDGTSFDGAVIQNRWAFDREAAGSATQPAGLAAQSVPAVPTLGDLLGVEADQFWLIEMKPAVSGQGEGSP